MAVIPVGAEVNNILSIEINRLTSVTRSFGLQENATRVVFAKGNNNIIDSQKCVDRGTLSTV
jgi:hypothetical protein